MEFNYPRINLNFSTCCKLPLKFKIGLFGEFKLGRNPFASSVVIFHNFVMSFDSEQKPAFQKCFKIGSNIDKSGARTPSAR